MRRLVLLCVLLMLPIQGVWSAVQGIALPQGHCLACPMQAQHGGGEDAAPEPDHCADGGDLAAAGGCDANCPACMGHGMAVLIGVPDVPGSRAEGAMVACSARGAPDFYPDHPLRPPLANAA